MNAVLPEWVVPVMHGALAVGAHYIDMATRTPGGTVDDGYEAQMALDERFKGAGRTALITTGMTPGVTNTLAAILYEEAERCEAIHVRATSNFSSAKPIQVWSQETWYIDCQTPPLYFEGGAFDRAEPFGGREYYDFPAPYGRRPVTHHEHEEVSTLPRWLPKLGDKGLRCVDFKMGGSDAGLDTLQAVIGSGMASPEPRRGEGHDGASYRRARQQPATEPGARRDRRHGERGRDRRRGRVHRRPSRRCPRARHRHVLRLPDRTSRS